MYLDCRVADDQGAGAFGPNCDDRSLLAENEAGVEAAVFGRRLDLERLAAGNGIVGAVGQVQNVVLCLGDGHDCCRHVVCVAVEASHGNCNANGEAERQSGILNGFVAGNIYNDTLAVSLKSIHCVKFQMKSMSFA